MEWVATRVTLSQDAPEVDLNLVELLARGYFPKELPPPFSTRDFATACSGLSAPRPTKQRWTTPATLNLARPGSLRRQLSIPNPFSQLELSTQIVDGWTDIDAHLKKSKLSMSRPVYDPNGLRAMRMHRVLHEQTALRATKMSRARFVVKSDISECYASIYTHSIEWGLHTKAASKARVAKKGPLQIGGILDQAVRESTEGQTTGIPISPDTSLILAEIVLCAIDAQMQSRFDGIDERGFRIVDDFEYYASTQGEAEDVLLYWQSALADFSLLVNPVKTVIEPAPIPIESPWRTELAQFSFRDGSDKVRAHDITSFMSKAFQLVTKNENDGVLAYAIRVATAKVKGVESWTSLQRLMLAAGMAEPSCLRYVASALPVGDDLGAIDFGLFEEVLNDLCDYHAQREHGSEVTAALHMMRTLKLPLSEVAARNISRMNDSCSLLLLFEAIDANRVKVRPDMTDPINRAEDPEAWRSEDWLLAYECARNRWSNPAAINSQPHWAEILSKNVTFFNVAAVPTSTRRPASSPAKTLVPTPTPGSTPIPAPQTIPGRVPAPVSTPTPPTPVMAAPSEDDWWIIPPPEFSYDASA